MQKKISFQIYYFLNFLTQNQSKTRLKVGSGIKRNLAYVVLFFLNRCDGVVVRAYASQSVDLDFILLIESYQKTLKNGIHSIPAWRSGFRGCCGEQAGKFACCVVGRGT